MGKAGQFDMELVPNAYSQKRGLNTTMMDEVLSQIGDQYNRFSPRIRMQVSTITSRYFEITILDSLHERELGIGRDWPYSDPIPMGGAIITEDLAKYLKLITYIRFVE
ncbi:MAG: hypothetical protein EZS28_046442 [Streblomastix strix]|uniref:Uncharacterized protein n=1 Tax=Streblomastix strix TaxID=222440 RepID=A0A5J4TKF7_9EUKA|nr:MAG: hypothetical protein EZS28_046442 [Streblomastix strix]